MPKAHDIPPLPLPPTVETGGGKEERSASSIYSSIYTNLLSVIFSFFSKNNSCLRIFFPISKKVLLVKFFWYGEKI